MLRIKIIYCKKKYNKMSRSTYLLNHNIIRSFKITDTHKFTSHAPKMFIITYRLTYTFN